MSDPRIVLVDRNVRTRPRMSWPEAWATSRGHDLSTATAWSYARETVEHGGVRAVVPAALTWCVLSALFLAVAFGAAVLAASAQSATKSAALILLASVVLSQVLTAAQNRWLARRLFIVANVRVVETPSGWAIAWVRMASRDAPRAKSMLLAGRFLHVETYYYRGLKAADIAAYYRINRADGSGEQEQHALILLADTLGATDHLLTGVNVFP